MKNVVRFLGVVGFSFIVSCIPDSFEIDDDMILEKFSLLPIYEPSGLSYSPNKDFLYTVSDRGQVYKIGFDGKKIDQLPYTDEDFEGVTVNSSTSNIYVVKERTGELVELTPQGTVINTYKVIGDSGNSGLEGITYDSSRDVFYLLKEKTPGLLITYSLKTGKIKERQLSFAIDYSGIYYNKATDNLWITSQESNTLTKCNVSGTPITEYSIPVYSIEGVVVNDEETEAYIVSDKDNMLYKINLLFFLI
jgi:uncharacterized protein YjiK